MKPHRPTIFGDILEDIVNPSLYGNSAYPMFMIYMYMSLQYWLYIWHFQRTLVSVILPILTSLSLSSYYLPHLTLHVQLFNFMHLFILPAFCTSSLEIHLPQYLTNYFTCMCTPI